MNHKHSRYHIVKRNPLPWYKEWAIRGIAIVLALIFCGILTSLLTGYNPLKVYITIFEGNFGTSRRVWNMLQNVAMLLCVAVGLTPAFRMRFWNIGGEGQIMIGALASALCMIKLGGVLPNVVLIPVMLVAEPCRRRHLGRDPRVLQGALEHERDTVYADDELCGDPAGGVFHHPV